MALEGDDTISQRLMLVRKQQALMQAKIAELKEMLDTLDYKCWYYETAEKAGTTSVPKNMTDEEIPPRFAEIRRKLMHE